MQNLIKIMTPFVHFEPHQQPSQPSMDQKYIVKIC